MLGNVVKLALHFLHSQQTSLHFRGVFVADLEAPSALAAAWAPSTLEYLLRGTASIVPRRILVVDDEPMVRTLIARVLTDAGYEVVVVADGRAALEAARGAETKFDMIVTNNYMPGLSGPELVARVRHDFPDLPILHVDDVTHRRRANELPADVPTIYKPFSIAILREAVRKLLSR